jgi:RNA polymerase sigma-70 factor (ECF subfamily)
VTREFEAFFASHYDRTRRAMVVALGDGDLAEEATQEAFCRALRRWRKVAGLERPEAWVLLVALNVSRDGARRGARHRAKAPLLASASAVADRDGEVDDRMALTEMLAAMPDRQRQALVLRFFGQLSVAEVARAMGCAEGTVKSTLHAALASARTSMEGVR